VLAAIVMRVATGFFGERMAQQAAVVRLAGHDARAHELEILARVRLAPSRGTIG